MRRFTLIVCCILLLISMVLPVTADSINTVVPAIGQTGKTVTVTITGSGFTTTTGAVKLMNDNDSNITATIESWEDSATATKIVCKFRISSSKDTGAWDLVVIRGYDNKEIVKTNGFTIIDPIKLTSISPTTARAVDDVDFTLVGTGLDDVQEVFLYNEDYDDNITAYNIDAEDTKVKGTFDLEDADEDTYDVCVEDSNGAVECDLSFKITTNKVGSIDISSSPSGASIFLDGLANGTTPATLDDIYEGSYKVILRKTGYEEWGKTVTVTDGETTEIDAKLYATATAAPAQTTNPTPVPTTPRTTRTTVKSTIKVPTTYAEVPTTTTASPLDPLIVIGAAGIGIGLVGLRRR